MICEDEADIVFMARIHFFDEFKENDIVTSGLIQLKLKVEPWVADRLINDLLRNPTILREIEDKKYKIVY